VNKDPMIHEKDSVSWAAFETPQLLIKLAWRRSTRRFQARIVKRPAPGVLCSTSYVSVHSPSEQLALLEAACAAYNSKLASYVLLHTSSRFASFIQEVNADDLLRMPIPRGGMEVNNVREPADFDQMVRRAFRMKPADWVLVEDAFEYTLSAFQSVKQKSAEKSVQPVADADDLEMEIDVGGPPRRVAGHEMLTEYGEAFATVIRAGFGEDKRVHTTVFRTPANFPAPVHLVAVHLGWPDGPGIEFHDVSAEALLTRIVDLAVMLEDRSGDGVTLRRRVARVYDTVVVGRRKVPTVYLCKPNVPRYWTRSMAMRDADEVSADLVLLAEARRPGRGAVSA
jgi:hypothetical protein